MTLPRAPAGLRMAIQKTLGGPAGPGAGAKEQAELIAADGVPGDYFGLSLAVSGATAVVGAPYNNSATGAAYVFVRTGTKWSPQAELTAGGGAPGDYFGLSVAVSGSTLVVGAPYRDSETGAAYVFARAGTSWSQQAELTASDGAPGDYFGRSAAVSGSTLVLGAPYRNSGTGAAYVFARSRTSWSQQAELTASDGAQGDTFGLSLAVSGATTVVGAYGHDTDTGAAYVFARAGTSWSQQAELTASDGAPDSVFGYSVAVSKSTAVVGAPFHNSDTGAAYVYARSGTAWTQQAELTATNGGQGDAFGASVAVSATRSGSTALVGAPYHASSAGAAYVFTSSGASWSKRGHLTASDAASGNELGYTVALSGSTAVVGAPFRNSDTGAAYVFLLPSRRR